MDENADVESSAAIDTARASSSGLRRWMLIVGGFYVAVGLFNTPPVIRARFPVQYPDLGVAPGSAAAEALVDVWFMFGLEVLVIGVALLLAARSPQRHRVLVWTVIGLEAIRGIADDAYLLARGYDPPLYVAWIVVHALIIATGLIALRGARQPAQEVARDGR